MSGNANLDAQIARAIIPQFNAMQAVQQMQRPMPQQVQNPIFGGQVPIPMNFGLPQASQIPANFNARPAYRPAAFDSYLPQSAPSVVGGFDQSMGWNPNGVYSQGHGGGGE
jgi:hypothetical protein